MPYADEPVANKLSQGFESFPNLIFLRSRLRIDWAPQVPPYLIVWWPDAEAIHSELKWDGD